MSLQLQEVIARVRSQLNDPSQIIFSNAEITNLVSDWISEVSDQTDAFFKRATFTTVAGTRTYDLPQDWLRTKRMVYNNVFILPGVSYNQIYKLTNNLLMSGTPAVYYIERDVPVPGTVAWTNGRIGLWRVPTSAVTIEHFYVYTPTAPSAMFHRIPLPPGADNGAVNYVCWKLKVKDREPQEAAYFEKLYRMDMVDMERRLTAQPDSRRVMGADDARYQNQFARMDPSVFEKE